MGGEQCVFSLAPYRAGQESKTGDAQTLVEGDERSDRSQMLARRY